MATTFNIGVVITAVDKASGVISRVGNSAKVLSDPIGKMGTSLLKIGAAATAAAGAVGALGAKLMGDFLETTGEIRDFSAQVGWSAEALQSWRYAAKQAGVANEEFDKSVGVMTRNIGQLRGRTGPLYDMLAKRAPEVLKQVRAAKPEEAFGILVRAMEAIPDPAKRAAFAQAAFGKSGAVMSRLAVEGSASLERMMEEARKLGIIISTKDVDAAEQFGDRLDTLKMAAQGVGNKFMAALVPALDKAVGGMTKWIEENQEWLRANAVRFAERLGDVLTRIGQWFVDHREDIKNTLVKGFELTSKTVGFIAEHIDGIIKAVEILATIWVAGKLVSGFQTAVKVAKELQTIWTGMSGMKPPVPGGAPGGGAGGLLSKVVNPVTVGLAGGLWAFFSDTPAEVAGNIAKKTGGSNPFITPIKDEWANVPGGLEGEMKRRAEAAERKAARDSWMKTIFGEAGASSSALTAMVGPMSVPGVGVVEVNINHTGVPAGTAVQSPKVKGKNVKAKQNVGYRLIGGGTGGGW